MVRNYKRKSVPLDTEKLVQAITAIQRQGISVRQASRMFGINNSTLNRYVKAIRNEESHGSLVPVPFSDIPGIAQKKVRTAFTEQQELALVEYLNHNADPHFGLTSKDVKVMGAQFAQGLNITVPGWNENGMAGCDWYKGFVARHPSLNVRDRKTTNDHQRLTINRENVEKFLDHLRTVYPVQQKTSGTTKNPISCTICNATFGNLEELTEHIDIHPQEEIYECAHCRKRFLNKATLSAHIWHHKIMLNKEKSTKDELFCCPTCAQIIRGRYHFHDHQAIHTFVRPFMCAICSMRFQTQNELLIHEKSVHVWEGPNYPCSICGFKFKYQGNVKKHMQQHEKYTKKKGAKREKILPVTAIYPIDPEDIKMDIKTEIEDFDSEIDLITPIKDERDPLWEFKQEDDE